MELPDHPLLNWGVIVSRPLRASTKRRVRRSHPWSTAAIFSMAQASTARIRRRSFGPAGPLWHKRWRWPAGPPRNSGAAWDKPSNAMNGSEGDNPQGRRVRTTAAYAPAESAEPRRAWAIEKEALRNSVVAAHEGRRQGIGGLCRRGFAQDFNVKIRLPGRAKPPIQGRTVRRERSGERRLACGDVENVDRCSVDIG